MRLLANGKLTTNFGTDCRAMRELLSRVGEKWSVLVLVLLGDGPVRFNDLKRSLEGISQKVLTATLRALERDGLVRRDVSFHAPPQVEYRLTELGMTILEPVRVLALWAHDHRADVHEARERYDRNTVGALP